MRIPLISPISTMSRLFLLYLDIKFADGVFKDNEMTPEKLRKLFNATVAPTGEE